ncbi:MAG: hypothetical protein FJ207_13140 [Gemmatimonadetes bacterium]|nr:hypothetical protein [Gemmatimonadota bacterium]
MSAGTVVGELGARMIRDPSAAPAVSLRDLQPALDGSASAPGSLAQSEVVPAARPMAIGGGSISAVGSEAGSDAITALTFNPAIFYGSDRSGESVARNSRLADVTIYFPMDELDRDADGGIDYFGVQLRVNVTGLGAGSALWSAAEGLRDLTVIETRETERLELALRGMPADRSAACVEQVGQAAAPSEAVVAACGADLRPDLDLPTYEEFRQSLVPLKEQADSRYFGLDVRMDFGDPTLGGVANASAVSINAGLALGKQFVGAEPLAPSAGVRLRGGVRYTDSQDLGETALSADAGLGFVLRRPVDYDKAVTLSSGFELRFGDVDEALEGALQSDYVAFRAGLSVPITAQAGITVSFAQPLVGDAVSQTLSVTGDWRLLLPLIPVEE